MAAKVPLHFLGWTPRLAANWIPSAVTWGVVAGALVVFGCQVCAVVSHESARQMVAFVFFSLAAPAMVFGVKAFARFRGLIWAPVAVLTAHRGCLFFRPKAIYSRFPVTGSRFQTEEEH